MSGLLFEQRVQDFIILIEESTRASQLTSKYFIEPAPGVLSRANSRRHHIVFGRRGSGKSSLLNKIHSENLVKRVPSAFIDLEKFKGHTYPDLLVSILIDTFSAFADWLENAAVAPATKKSFWAKVTDLVPQSRKADISDTQALAVKLRAEISELEKILFQATSSESERITREKSSLAARVEGELGVATPSVTAKSGGSLEEGAEAETQSKVTYQSNKHELLQRSIIRYQALFSQIKAVSKNEVFLILDDLYHIRRADQAEVLDYFHKIAKGGNFWLKIGTVRHRTSHYRNGDPPVGMKLSDDVDSIDLDVTLENYATTKKFLFEILGSFAAEHNIETTKLLTDGARDRLVLVSGGVARDFLSLFRKSVSEARERINAGGRNRGDRVTAEDVNRASGRYYDDKLQELSRDTTSEDRLAIENAISAIRDFCFEKSNANILLIEKDTGEKPGDIIGELVDLKIIHRVKSGVTVSKRQGDRFDAYMLDFSFYTGDRTKKGFEVVEFWIPSTRDDIVRKVGYIYE